MNIDQYAARRIAELEAENTSLRKRCEKLSQLVSALKGMLSRLRRDTVLTAISERRNDVIAL